MNIDNSKNYTVITPDDGMKLTNAERTVFVSQVTLAKNDSADNWTEITDAEAEELQKALEEAQEQQEEEQEEESSADADEI